MRKRAWILHSIYTIQRIVSWLTGTANWTKDACQGLEELAEEGQDELCRSAKLDLIRPSIQVCVPIVLFACLVLDILCYKWRSLTNLIIHIEVVVATLVPLVPTVFWATIPSFFVTIIFFLIFIAFFTDGGSQLITITVGLALHIFAIQIVGYGHSLTKFDILRDFIMLLLCFVACAGMAILAGYISKLHNKSILSMTAQIALIDNMHEGLLILKKDSK